jgi:hypothetical protein
MEWRTFLPGLRNTASNICWEIGYSDFSFVVTSALCFNFNRDFFLTDSIGFTFLILLSHLKDILRAPLNNPQINRINNERRRNDVQ